MRDDIAPFKLRYKNDRLRLWLHGTEEQRIVVEKNKIHIILDAIAEGYDIDILYAIIDGDVDIRTIDNKLEKDDEGRRIIKGNIHIFNSEFRGYTLFISASFMGDVYFTLVSFMDDTYFRSASFSINANFRSASFMGDAIFSEASLSNANLKSASFNGNTYFISVSFKGKTNFSLASFSGNTYFSSSFFNGHIHFESTSFITHVNFGSTSFVGMAYFSDTTFPIIAEFNYSNFVIPADLAKANLSYISPRSLNSIGNAYVRSSISGAHYFFKMAGDRYWNNGKYNEASDSFRNAKVEYDKEGMYDESSRMYIKEKDSARLNMKLNKNSPVKCTLLTAWKYTCNYGENPLWFIGLVAAIVLVFAVIYLPIMPDSWWPSITFRDYPYHDWNSGVVDGALFNIVTAIYFSIVTFATLGFGDISPISITGKIATIVEVLLGYAMFGVLITLVARKMTRS